MDDKTMKITQSVKSAVNAYLMARTLAECERKKVNSLAREILETATYQADPKLVERGHAIERITDPDKAWMLEAEEHHDYLLDLRKAMQDAGYTIKSIPGEPEYSYNCPALTAESLQRDAEHLIIDTMAEMLGESKDLGHNLICAGLDKYHQFIDLAVGMVVNMPGFKNPLTNK
jgi:hypothetical protein